MLKTEKEKAKIIREFVEGNQEIVEKAKKIYNKHDIEVDVAADGYYQGNDIEKVDTDVEYWYYNPQTKELFFENSLRGLTVTIYDWLHVGLIEVKRFTFPDNGEVKLEISRIVDPIDHWFDKSDFEKKEEKVEKYIVKHNLQNHNRIEAKTKERKQYPSKIEGNLTRKQLGFYHLQITKNENHEYCRKCGKKVHPKLNKVETLMFNEYFSHVDYNCICGYSWKGKLVVDITPSKELV